MSVHKTKSINNQPVIELLQWRIYEVDSSFSPEKTRHLVGFHIEEQEGRVSSRIAEFNSEDNLFKTGSGRIYKIIGKSGHNMDAMYVWDTWKKLNKVTISTDVTEEYIK